MNGKVEKMGIRKYRRKYYDFFSHFYDAFIALHSRDQRGELREFLVQQAKLKPANRALDICTGTGSVLPNLQKQVGAKGLVVGVDFSHGMLQAANKRWRDTFPHFCLVEADVAHLPFRKGSFDSVTCSHAFYELKGETRDAALQEIVRILKGGKLFLMMEHDVPKKLIIRVLFYLRIFFVGSGNPLEVLRSEEQMFQRYFRQVRKIRSNTEDSKIFICQN